MPDGTRIAPLPLRLPTAPGMQTAQVMDAPGEPLHTDRDGRIRVQFDWQRGTPGDHRSGTWVRVAQGMVGPNWGAMFTPRAGSEVLVDFIDGDIDRPTDCDRPSSHGQLT